MNRFFSFILYLNLFQGKTRLTWAERCNWIPWNRGHSWKSWEAWPTGETWPSSECYIRHLALCLYSRNSVEFQDFFQVVVTVVLWS